MAYTRQNWVNDKVALTPANLDKIEAGIVDAKEPWYGTCSTEAGTIAKVVTCAGFTLKTGSRVCVKFTNSNLVDSPTLNVNSTGAKNIVDNTGAYVKIGAWEGACIVEFAYNGSYWQLINTSAATSTMLGTVKLSDSAISSSDASGKTAATPEAVYTAYKHARKGHYGTSVTAAATATKVVSLYAPNDENCASAGFELVTGTRITVKFSYANTASSPQLNVDSTGAKYIRKYGSTSPSTYTWNAGEAIDFVYDGTAWLMIGRGEATTEYYGVTKLSSSTSSTATNVAATPAAVYSAYSLANNANSNANTATNVATAANNATKWYVTCSTAATTAAKTATLSGFVLNQGVRVTVNFTYDNTVDIPTLNINSTGAKSIYFNGSRVTYDLNRGIYELMYDGTQYQIISGMYSSGSVTYTGYNVGTPTTDTVTLYWTRVGDLVTLYGTLKTSTSITNWRPNASSYLPTPTVDTAVLYNNAGWGYISTNGYLYMHYYLDPTINFGSTVPVVARETWSGAYSFSVTYISNGRY